MRMSIGHVGRLILGLGFTGAALMSGSAAIAGEVGVPEPWGLDLQAAATPVMESIQHFHDGVLVVITLITLFVLALLVTVMVRFNARANPVPSRTTHNTMIEVAWTLIPVLILVSIA
ncbi:MAG: cytochrome c oxidase subunit II, partial [Bradyrhizobium sp.]|nr:cytochrome c oxidase subunit II [Bradyrhizobium sp.]